MFSADSHHHFSQFSKPARLLLCINFLCSSLNKSLFTSVVSHQLTRTTIWVHQTVKISYVFFFFRFFFILYLFIAFNFFFYIIKNNYNMLLIPYLEPFKFKHLFFYLFIYFFVVYYVSVWHYDCCFFFEFLLFCCFEFVYCFRL